jgi:hypothetical protein
VHSGAGRNKTGAAVRARSSFGYRKYREHCATGADLAWGVRHSSWERYAGLQRMLSDRMGEKELDQALHDVGGFRASRGKKFLLEHRNDFESFCKAIKVRSVGRRSDL